MDKKVKIENALWEKYNAAFMKMEDTLRSCKTEKHLLITSKWIDEVLANYKKAETEGKSSRMREAVKDYMMKKIETFNEIYFEMLREITKEKAEDFKRYEKDWSDAKNRKCPCC